MSLYLPDIRPVILHVIYVMAEAYNPKLASLDATELLMRTGAAESQFTRLVQIGGGPGLGLFQMEPGLSGAQDILDWLNARESRKPLIEAINGLVGGPGWQTDLSWYLKTSLSFQVAFARLKYWRDSEPIPAASDLTGQAAFWKRVYNTRLGKGTTGHFMNSALEAGLA